MKIYIVKLHDLVTPTYQIRGYFRKKSDAKKEIEKIQGRAYMVLNLKIDEVNVK